MQSVCRFFVLLLLSLFISSELHSQRNLVTSVTGKISDSSTGVPLKNVNIYVAHTQQGTTSDSHGNFNFPILGNGSYELVFSHVGYRAQTKRIRIINPTVLKYDIYLQPVPYNLDEVIVKDTKDDEWNDNYKIFVKEFIGQTENAAKTKILNPFFLNFETEWDGSFTASSDLPLEIINEALGYKIIYFLEYFEYAFDYVKYTGIPVFEEITPKSEQQRIEFEANRVKAYNGSLRHFLTLICENYFANNRSTVSSYDDDFFAENGFEVNNQIKRTITSNVAKFTKYVEEKFTLSPEENETELNLNFENYLEVIYYNEIEEDNYLTLMNLDRKADVQESWILLHADTVTIDINGRYFDDFMIQKFGYWAYDRIADIVPNDYFIKQDEKEM